MVATPGTRMWRQIAPRGDAPASRFGYVSMTYKNVFLLFGGYDGSTWLNDMHEYNFGTCAALLKHPRVSVEAPPRFCVVEMSCLLLCLPCLVGLGCVLVAQTPSCGLS